MGGLLGSHLSIQHLDGLLLPFHEHLVSSCAYSPPYRGDAHRAVIEPAAALDGGELRQCRQQPSLQACALAAVAAPADPGLSDRRHSKCSPFAAYGLEEAACDHSAADCERAFA